MTTLGALYPIVDRQGWTEDTVILLVRDWLEKHPRYLNSLENYLERVAREENSECEAK